MGMSRRPKAAVLLLALVLIAAVCSAKQDSARWSYGGDAIHCKDAQSGWHKARKSQTTGTTKADYAQKKCKAGLSWGEYYRKAPQQQVLLNDGAAAFTANLWFRPRDRRERVNGSHLKKYDDKILRPEDVSMVADKVWSHASNYRRGDCAEVTYNITMDFDFNRLVGPAEAEVMVLTSFTAKKKHYTRHYTFKFKFLVVGVVLYEYGPSHGRDLLIRSGDAHESKSLGSYKDILEHDVVGLRVAVQGPDLKRKPDPWSMEMRLYDPTNNVWPKYLNWDASCPASYLRMKSKGRRSSPDFDQENGMCNAAFTSDMTGFFVQMNHYRVGCGRFCAEITWPELNVDGVDFTTNVCFDVDLNPEPPVVVDCKDVEPDYYGGEKYTFDAFNLNTCEDELDAKVKGTMVLGKSDWDIVAVRGSQVDQLVTVRAPAFEETGSHDSKVPETSGYFELQEKQGGRRRVDAIVVCSDTQQPGVIAASYTTKRLAEPEEPTHRRTGEEVVEVQIFTAGLENLSTARVSRYIEALPGASGRLVGIRSSAVDDCTGQMCLLRSAATHVSGGHGAGLSAYNQLTGSEAKIHITVDAADAEEVTQRVFDSAGGFPELVDGVDAYVSYVGPAREGFETLDASGTAQGAPERVTAGLRIVMGAGLTGLCLMMFVVLFVVFTSAGVQFPSEPLL